MFKCTKCSKEFKYQSEKQRHEESHNPKYKCEKCDKKFSFHSALRRHEKQHMRSSAVKCLTCGHKFLDEILLKRHIKYAHGDTFTCEICESSFHSETALRIHSKSHKAKSEREFKCSHVGCDKAFNYKHHLKHHELAHKAAKQYKCYVCGKGFIQLHHRNTHMKSHDPKSHISCEVMDCNKKFSSVYAMRRHLTSHNKTSSSTSSSIISPSHYEKHKSSCYNNNQSIGLKDKYKENQRIELKDNHKENQSSELKDRCNEYQLTDLKDEHEKSKIENKHLNVNNNCKTALGTCIVSGSSDINENCLCLQMTENSEEIDNIDTSLIELNHIIKEDSVRNNVVVNLRSKSTTENNSCRGCDSAYFCDAAHKTSKDKYSCPFKYEVPVVKYTFDGAIKIADTCDIDFNINEENVNLENANKIKKSSKSARDFVPLNSCKEILGKCIVSEDGSVGEGCLCAKIGVNEQQFDAQEIEELTPISTTNNLNDLL